MQDKSRSYNLKVPSPDLADINTGTQQLRMLELMAMNMYIYGAKGVCLEQQETPPQLASSLSYVYS